MTESLFHQARHAQAALENRIIKGIAAEWDSAIRDANLRGVWLPDLLNRPLFQLADMEFLGSWDRTHSTISLQRRFVLEHPWDAVVEVVKHETAHQLADQFLHAPAGAPPHGPEFREACRILRILPRATGDYRSLRESLLDGFGGDSDRLLGKIRKLLALAESGETHEAESALAKAQSLIMQYNLNLIEVKRQRDFYALFLGKPSVRRDLVLGSLGALLSDFYCVESIWTTSWVVEAERFGRALEINGAAENLRVAEYVFHFILRHIDSAWERFQGKQRLGSRAKRDFGLGVVRGVRQRLEQEQITAHPQHAAGRALMLWRDPELNAFHRFRHPRISKTRNGNRTFDQDSFQAGVQEGSRLQIRPGLNETASTGPRLLPFLNQDE